MISRKGPVRLLRRLAEETEDGNWVVKVVERSYRTESGRHMFSSRVKTLWSYLSEEDKHFNLNSVSQLRRVKEDIK